MMWNCGSKVVGGSALGLVLVVDPLRAVRGADVAEPVLWTAGNPSSRGVGRQAADQVPEVLVELVG